MDPGLRRGDECVEEFIEEFIDELIDECVDDFIDEFIDCPTYLAYATSRFRHPGEGRDPSLFA